MFHSDEITFIIIILLFVDGKEDKRNCGKSRVKYQRKAKDKKRRDCFIAEAVDRAACRKRGRESGAANYQARQKKQGKAKQTHRSQFGFRYRRKAFEKATLTLRRDSRPRSTPKSKQQQMQPRLRLCRIQILSFLREGNKAAQSVNLQG